MLARALVMITVAGLGLVATSEAALAFTRTKVCSTNSLTIRYNADNGELLGHARWHWFAGGFLLSVHDARPSDGAVMAARVNTVGGTVREFYSGEHNIAPPVIKWRTVWNGYASDWYPGRSCG